MYSALFLTVTIFFISIHTNVGDAEKFIQNKGGIYD